MALSPKLGRTQRALTTTLFYPVFILLHLTFILSSLTLRTYQTLTAPRHTARALIEDERRGSNATGDAGRAGCPQPRHLGLVLVPSRRKGQTKKDRAALVQSVLRAAEWAEQRGIAEVSVWDGQGLTQSALPTLMRHLNTQPTLPLSPPASSPSTPTLRPTQDGVLSPPDSPSPVKGAAKDLMEGVCGREAEDRLSTVGSKDQIGGVTTLQVPSTSPQSRSKLTIHLLPPSSSGATIATLTRRYTETGVDVADITVKAVDRDIKDQLHFTNDPDLLLIHHLSSPSLFERLLPRRAPELWGYPFWTLRITEIYQYPTPLPIPTPFLRIIGRLQSSSLPFVRKVAQGVSLPPPGDGPQGVLGRAEWEDAMRAWEKVEQRLGR